MKNNLPITEELDFAYLLELMLPLHNVSEFAWLPELFSIVGYESLLKLCKYAGGETITIPTTDQLTMGIDALQWFYNIHIAKRNTIADVPKELLKLLQKIEDIYYVGDSKTSE